MYVLYEKVPKSEEHPNGIKRIEPDTKPFESGPCLISLVALAGNIASKTVDVIATKEDKTPADNGNKNKDSENANNNTPTETNDVKKVEDKTQAKTVILQAGATFQIIILTAISIIGIVGYKRFKKVNY